MCEYMHLFHSRKRYAIIIFLQKKKTFHLKMCKLKMEVPMKNIRDAY